MVLTSLFIYLLTLQVRVCRDLSPLGVSGVASCSIASLDMVCILPSGVRGFKRIQDYVVCICRGRNPGALPGSNAHRSKPHGLGLAVGFRASGLGFGAYN